MNNYTFSGIVHKIVDGDTLDVLIDLGFHTATIQRLRLKDINTSEINSSDSSEREKAIKAKNRVSELLKDNTLITLTTHKTDKYGRYVADVFIPSQKLSLSNILLSEGLAEVYPKVSEIKEDIKNDN